MKTVVVRVDIKRTRADIYAVLEDAETNPKWRRRFLHAMVRRSILRSYKRLRELMESGEL
jgi:hypothetical protein